METNKDKTKLSNIYHKKTIFNNIKRFNSPIFDKQRIKNYFLVSEKKINHKKISDLTTAKSSKNMKHNQTCKSKRLFEINKDEGKEYYNNGQIKFEGEYLNNKRYNGKLYDINGNIECEIKYGKGFGKDYYYNGILKYEGDYYLNGKGKEYNEYDILIFEGEHLNGKRNGKGKEYFCGELVFDGEYLYGKKHGKAKEYDKYKNKLLFEGEYLYGKRNGIGKEYNWYNGILEFEGEYLNGKRNGIGREYDEDGKLVYKS
jgi:antitoxin component YwqK of YwqJK toxin-antitoxin module